MRRVTIIDDDSDSRKLLENFLRHNNFFVESFATAEEFLAAASSHVTDLYVIDINLGGMSGDKLCALIKGGSHVTPRPVVIISAHPEVEQLSTAVCADAFLPRPFSRQVLLQKINDFAF